MLPWLGDQVDMVELQRRIRDGAQIKVVCHGDAAAHDDDVPTDIGIATTGVGCGFHGVRQSARGHPCDQRVIALRCNGEDVEIGGAVGWIGARQIFLQVRHAVTIGIRASYRGIERIEAVLLFPAIGYPVAVLVTVRIQQRADGLLDHVGFAEVTTGLGAYDEIVGDRAVAAG